MRIVGEWFTCTDGVSRPTLFGRVRAGAGPFFDERFLIDTGADRTVFSAELLSRLDASIPTSPIDGVLAGIGGIQSSVLLQAELQFDHDSGIAVIRGEYAAFTDVAATDLSVLGRDVLNLFDVIASRRCSEILLLAAPHSYVVSSS